MKHKTKMNEQGIAHLVPIIAVLVLIAVGGVGYRVYSQTSKPKASVVSTEKAEDKAVLNTDLSTIKSLGDIQTQAQGQLNGANIHGVQLEAEDGVLVYKFVLSDGRVLTFNATTGSQTGTSEKTEQDSEGASPITLAGELISFAKAREVAVAEQPGKDVSKIELETEDGVLVFSVRFTDGSRVDVHAKTAVVVRTKGGEAKSGSSSSGSSSSGSGSNSSGSSGSSGGGGSSSSSVTHDDSGNDDGDDDSSTSTSTPTPSSTAASGSISESQAKTIANNRLPGRTIEKIESDTEDGAAVFSVRYTDDGRVDVRKSDGVIVRVKE